MKAARTRSSAAALDGTTKKRPKKTSPGATAFESPTTTKKVCVDLLTATVQKVPITRARTAAEVGPTNKRPKTASSAIAAEELPCPASLIDAYFERLEAVVEREKAVGAVLMRGVGEGGDVVTETEGGDEVCTAGQLADLRHILITGNRKHMLESAMQFAKLGSLPDGKWCKTSSAHADNAVIYGIRFEIAEAMGTKTLAGQFDALFAMTYVLNEYFCLMGEHALYGEGGELDEAVGDLAAAWRSVLQHSDAQLKIDPEFTRPGIESLLAQLCAVLGLQGE